ncbi:MAG: TetR family transcriptional regulator [Reyranella sp.]|nr:TetR family transcriptional regulator [Reyranella sp.]
MNKKNGNRKLTKLSTNRQTGATLKKAANKGLRAPFDGKGAEAESVGRIRKLTMAHIVASAERVFAEAGFGGASMLELARAAEVPKANVHYYFGNKEGLYKAVLDNVLANWISTTDHFQADSDPVEALSAYIRAKVELSKTRPFASKVFANEILHGAPQLQSYLANDLRMAFEEKSRIIKQWAAKGLMKNVEPMHLFFCIWAMTQTYADFEAQIRAVLGIQKMTDDVYRKGTDMITQLVLGGCAVRSSKK